ncbi:MAG: trypsin-like peptidase domain-containing protein, partial [Pseudomonadota bacterium]
MKPSTFARTTSTTVALLLAVIGCSSGDWQEPTASKSDPVIYVPPSEQTRPDKLINPEVALDKRREVWEDENPVPGQDTTLIPGWSWMRSYAQQATVGLMNRQSIDCALCSDPNDLDLVEFNDSPLLGDFSAAPGCADQKFQGQARAAFCSGTLIADDLILTAGHCLREEGQIVQPASQRQFTPQLADNGCQTSGKLQNLRVVFNYFNPGPNQTPRVSRTKDVFKVREVAWTASNAGDISILQLVDDNGNPRSAVPRFQPVPMRRSKTPMPINTSTIGAIGAPHGIPLKISVTKSQLAPAGANSIGLIGTDRYTMQTRLDALGGNSGGGIYDVDDFSLASWVHSGEGLAISGQCVNPGLASCKDCQGNFIPGHQISNLIIDEFPSNLNQCWRAYYSPMSDSDMVDARKFLEKFLDPNSVTLSVPFKFGESSTIDLLRVMYCGDALTNETRLSTTVGILGNLGLDGGGAQPQIADSSGIIANSRLCKERGDDSASAANMHPILVQPGRELTLEGDTGLGSDVVDLQSISGGSCKSDAGTPDALFNLEVTAPTLLYADTFSPTADKDTVVFLMRVANNSNAVSAAEFLSCSDDSECNSDAQPQWFQQSQFTYPARAGHYILGVTGFHAADKGRFYLHVQGVPFSLQNRIIVAAPGVGDFTQSYQDTTASGVSNDAQHAPRCQFVADGVESTAPD